MVRPRTLLQFNLGYGLTDPRDYDLVSSAAPFVHKQSLFANFKPAVTRRFEWESKSTDTITTVQDGTGPVT